MGNYTELVLNVDLKKDTPKEIIHILKHMLDGVVLPTNVQFNHPLFETERWRHMLICDSAYFPGVSHHTFIEEVSGWRLCFRCNLKNYNGEIGKFLNWITPFVKTKGFWGYSRYEDVETPSLIYSDRMENEDIY